MHSMEELIVSVTRSDLPLIEIPGAVFAINESDIQLGRQQLGIDESLSRIPGLFFQNRYNFAQDLRISIRGFGARSNFGIRGIKIYTDEIPATLADGQSGIDDLDIGSTQRIEVIRGPFSSLYGSASGGVISLKTEEGPEIPFIEARLNMGDFAHRKYQLKAGGQFDNLNYFLNVSSLTMDGYRDHSRVEHDLINSRFQYEIDGSSDLTVIINAIDSPLAEDAGGVTVATSLINPEQAGSRNISSNAGEALAQQKLGLVYHRDFDEYGKLTMRNYYLWRDFSNFLPIGNHIPFVADDGVVEFDRFFYGGGVQYSLERDLFEYGNRLIVGFDIDIQQDDRQRYINDAGAKGTLSFDQLERAESYGFYLRNELTLSDTVVVTLGVRFDRVDMTVVDRFITNADQSGALVFDEFSPLIAIMWMPSDNRSFYFSYASSFETPAFTELAVPARNLNVNLGGFSNVTAQTADSFEFGSKGILFGRLNYDIAVFTMPVYDEITNITNIGNRSFFENADTDRSGLETSAQYSLTDNLVMSIAYTWSSFKFKSFVSDSSVEGNHLPGIPEHQFYSELAYTANTGLYIIGDLLYVGSLFADNSNSVKVPGYKVVNVRIGKDIQVGDWTVSPFLGINNLFDESYNSNVRINAFGGRYFEPAPDTNIYGGIKIRLDY